MFSLMGNLLSAGVSALGIIGQSKTTQLVNKLNREQQQAINDQNLDFSKSMTQAQWERDDNAYQRAVADLEKAGLSPLAMSGPSPNTPAVTSGPMESTMQYQAPQLDFNSLAQSLSALGSSYLKERELKLEYDKLGKEDEWHNDEIQTKLMEIENDFQNVLNESAKIRVQDKQVNAQIKEINNAIQISQERLKEDIAHNKFIENEQFENDRYIRIYDRIKELTPEGMRYIACFTDSEYVDALARFEKQYTQALKDVFGSVGATGIMDDGTNQTVASRGEGSNGSTAGVISLGINTNQTFVRDLTQAQKAQWARALEKLQFPIPFSESDKEFFDDRYTLRSSSKNHVNNYRE